MDPDARAALNAATRRLVLALGNVRRLEKALSNDDMARGVIGDVNLAAFIPKRTYALSALAAHFNLDSPVLRFSVRLALAMMAGALAAQSLGDERHGNWVLLTIAVVMRAGYGLTRQRRDARVIGTLVGCVLASGLVAYVPAGALVAVQGLAVAVTHSFARLNYRIASASASVMALVSLHLVQPWLSAPILVRLADTLIGAAIAHLFNYFWPRWESSEAPRLASRLLAQLAAFAAVALTPDVDGARLSAGAQERDRGDRRALQFRRAHEHRADGRAQRSRGDGGLADRGARLRGPALGGPSRRSSRRSRSGPRDPRLAASPPRRPVRRGRSRRRRSGRTARRRRARRHGGCSQL